MTFRYWRRNLLPRCKMSKLEVGNADLRSLHSFKGSLVYSGLTQLNDQSPVVRRFIAAGHRSQRPMNRATTIEVRKSYY